MTHKADQEKQEAIDHLRGCLKEGETLYTVLRHVSQSGLMRRISVLALRDSEIRHLDWYVAKALDRALGDREGVVVHGAGMDMGFELVYSLSYAVFGDGYKLNQAWI